MSTQQSVEELKIHLDDHVGFLARSSQAFDEGHYGESKRLAVSLRVLFHDTRHSHSLLGQLGRLGHSFITTATPYEAANLSSHGGLVMMSTFGGAAEYIAPLDTPIFKDWRPFEDWWSEPVFVDKEKRVLSRRNLILSVADQDGGAHVDPTLSETYARLSRHNSMGWTQMPGGAPIPHAEKAAIRQIAHEVLRTLIPTYRKASNKGDMVFGGGGVFQGKHAPALPRPQKIGRNEFCPCGSGQKFKKCHVEI